ncbi:MAG TPA: sigma-70 family RNA polymerase sigma factor [Thermoanaerobaculales bacterium]|nr:sigma-70 family RNA polymerase sigma factor [Thermoanaerobaculales bacterium]HQN94923.1 sigma-70 family RNA polymerase sigma factor [Thermoanaerobaculales bacterium]HQP44285.1 sigma-70 family RNA polymerase sigma factor [Thermoanaerobaculales bacterium]
MEPLELETVVERCREGDETAWAALVNATLRPIYRLCASYAPSAAEAEELTQEVYFKLWENLHQYGAGSNFMAWAWRVARNLLIDSYRRCHRERSAAWLDPEIIERLPAADDPHEESLRRQRLRIVATGLRQLPEELASLVLMRDLAGWSYSEIAEALDLPVGTVKSRLNRARLELATVVRRRMQMRVVPPAGSAAEEGA